MTQGKSRQGDLGNARVKGTHHRIHVEPVQAKRSETEVQQCTRDPYGQQIFHWPSELRLRKRLNKVSQATLTQ